MAITDKMFLEREAAPEQAELEAKSGYTDAELLELWKEWKKESFEYRWIWERNWMRNIHYLNNRMWIEYVRRTNEWRDVKLAKWFPKPVNPLIKQGMQVLRAMFTAVDIGVNVRPNGSDPKNIAVASIAEDYSPVLHNEHDMDTVLNEADYWFIGTGSVALHTFLERDAKHGYDDIGFSLCLKCSTISRDDKIGENKNACPSCQSVGMFTLSADPETGEPTKRIFRGKGVTIALSPFEIAFNNNHARFEDVPYVIRLRWRTKKYYEAHPVLAKQMRDFQWTKAPNETSLQLFRSLPYHNDTGVAPFLGQSGAGNDELGAPEYEVWVRPCNKYPEGLVFRVVGDAAPKILHQEEDEAIPGPLPYTTADGGPLFPFEFAAFEQNGGKVWGSSPFDAAIPKLNQLNQHDSFGLMVVNRMGNPLWLVPKGAEIQKFTGEPGLVVHWNPLTVNGAAEPKRIDGMELGSGFFKYREQLVHDVEEALGTYDVLKGTKPAGVEAFAALQLLVEQGQSRFASAFKARGTMYRGWFKTALEIEREFGPDERTEWILSPARKWTQKLFKRADLQGSFQVVMEDGSQKPKTSLGIRAAIEHLNGLGFIDPTDPDQRYAIYQAFGQTKLSPALDLNILAAQRKQEAFETWATDDAAKALTEELMKKETEMYQATLANVPMPAAPPAQADPMTGEAAPPDPAADQAAMQAALPPPPSPTMHTPLEWNPWYKADVHKIEFEKWMNSDRMVELLIEQPALKPILIAHYEEIKMAVQEQMIFSMGPQPPQASGAGRAMANSNQEAGGTGAMPGKPGAAKQAA
jgi:hypothetical protein